MEENTHDLQSMVLSFIFILQYTTHTHMHTHIYMYMKEIGRMKKLSLFILAYY